MNDSWFILFPFLMGLGIAVCEYVVFKGSIKDAMKLGAFTIIFLLMVNLALAVI